MKQQIKNCLAALTIVLISLSASSQTTINAPWVPEHGFWVVEQNIHDRFHHVIRFYNDDHQLIYKETLNNVKMNLGNQRTKMKLKKALEESLTRWEKNKFPEADKGYAAAVLK